MKVDVLVVTYNSARTLDRCLECIQKYVPVNRLLVGDGGSNDATIEIAKKHNAEIYQFKGIENKIGRIRYKLAEKAETSWILYVDSDVYLYPNFWKEISKWAIEGVGMIMAAHDTQIRSLRRYFEWRNRRFGFVTFSNTLVPRNEVLEVRDLLNIHVAEDATYARYVQKKGLKIIRLFKPLSFHDKPPHLFDLAFYRWGYDLGHRRRLMKLVASEAIHIRNILWYFLENITLNGLNRLLLQSLLMFIGFIHGLNKSDKILSQ